MMVHELKTWPKYFQAIKSGNKTFELRKNDRNYQVGDVLLLKEYNPKGWDSTSHNVLTGEYTGDQIECTVTYVLHPPPHEAHFFGMSSNCCVMSIKLNSCN